MVRNILVTVDGYGGTNITEAQYAGVQGEHNLCQVTFNVTALTSENYAYRGEFVDGNGWGWSTDLLTPVTAGSATTVSYLFPDAWTTAGGRGVARLVASKIVDNVETERVYVIDVPVYFKSKQEIDPQAGKDLYAGMSALLFEIHDTIEDAETATSAATTAANYANTEGVYANGRGDYANAKGDYAQTMGDYAKAQGDYAKEHGDAAKGSAATATAAAALAEEKAAYSQGRGDFANQQGQYASAKGAEATLAANAANSAAEEATEAAQNANNAANSINYIKDFVVEEADVTLPGELRGNYNIEKSASTDKVFCGTHNVIDLIGFKQVATYTYKDLTITVTGNTITASGTPDGNIVFSVVDGNGQTSATVRAYNLNIPDGEYSLSTVCTGAGAFPNLMIYGKTSGTVATAQNNVVTFTKNSSTGGMSMYFQSGRTYNCTVICALFPYATTAANTHRNETSSVTTYSDTGTYLLNGYTWAYGSPSLKKIESKLPKKCLCKYSTRTISYTGATEVLDVYVPAKTGYINYVFGHTVSASEQGDVWRLIQIDSVSTTFARRFHITQLGETEMAIKIKGRDDFIGGFTHGDESIVSGSFLAVLDGAPVDVTTLTSETEFDTLQIFLVTNMYDPNDHTTKVGEHGREWRFDKTGLLLDQTVTFAANLTLVNSYMPMLCAIRGNDTVSALQITDTYVDDGNFQQYDVSTGGFTTYPNQLKADVTDMHLFGKTSGVRASVELLERPTGLNGEGTYVYNGVNTYNKIYCTVCGYNAAEQSVSNGDKWHVKAKITVDAG